MVIQQVGGDKAAVINQVDWLKILVEDYENGAKKLTQMRFIGEFLDLEVEVVQSPTLISDEEE